MTVYTKPSLIWRVIKQQGRPLKRQQITHHQNGFDIKMDPRIEYFPISSIFTKKKKIIIPFLYYR